MIRGLWFRLAFLAMLCVAHLCVGAGIAYADDGNTSAGPESGSPPSDSTHTGDPSQSDTSSHQGDSSHSSDGGTSGGPADTPGSDGSGGAGDNDPANEGPGESLLDLQNGNYQVENERHPKSGGNTIFMPLQTVLDNFNKDVGDLVVDVQLIKVSTFLLYQIKYVDNVGTVKFAYYYSKSGLRVNLDGGQ